jgi:putative transposase
VKKSKFSETQIVSILREVEAGAKVGETCRKYGISDACYYQWKSKYAGMEVPQLAKMRELEQENARLKKMYAELALVHHAFQDAVAKKL